MAERLRRLNAEALWEYALRRLGGRSQSAGELRQKLLRRAERPEDVPEVLARLKSKGYLDDRSYAENFSRARLENQGFGKQRVLSDLRKRRVAPALAEQAVSETYRGTDEQRLIEDYLRRKYRGQPLHAHLAEPKNLAAAYRKLRLAGFGADNAIRVLKRFAREPELLDAFQDGEGDEAQED